MLNSNMNTQKIIKDLKIFALTLFLFLCIGSLAIAGDNDVIENGRVLSLETGYIGNSIVYVTDEGKPIIKNDLTFYIKAGMNVGEIKGKRNVSYIKIFFDYGRELGDLSTKQDASKFELSLLRNYGNEFELKPYPKGVNPHWMLTTRSDTFLFGGSRNRIEFKANLFSQLKPGLTTMHIEYGGIPEYRDGYVSLNIVKKKPEALVARYGLDVGDVNLVEKEEKLKIKGSLKLQKGGFVSGFSDDVALSENSNLNVPTEKAVKTYVDNRLPAGVIVMWSGAVDKIPAGWALCDSNNGTPDLRDRFVLGWGPKAAKNSKLTGGEPAVELNINHMPAHNHGANTGQTGTNYRGKVESPLTNVVAIKTARVSCASGSSMNKENHSHTIASEGKGEPHNNMPPYYVLAYIMKLSDSPAN